MTATGARFSGSVDKTGTTTLGECLTTLGYRHQSYNTAVLDAFVHGRIDPLVDMTRHFDSCEAPYACSNCAGRMTTVGSGYAPLGHGLPDAPFPHIRPRATGVDPAIRAQNLAQIDRQLTQIATCHQRIARKPSMQPAQ